MTNLRAFWHNINASYWFYPAVASILAVLLALTTIWLDRSGYAAFLSNVESLVPARPDGASNMLTVIAGSMIGVASTVFSITIAAVAYASGNYGPRLLTNFMEDRGNQFSLATFIGTFVYALTVLRSVRAADESALILEAGDAAPGFVPQLSLLVAFGLTGISIAVLVYFLNHIPASIRINTVLQGIGDRLLRMIDHRYSEDFEGERPRIIPEGGARIEATSTGYIQIIDLDELVEIADKHEARIVMQVGNGHFIHPGMTLARWIDDNAEIGGEVPYDKIRDCFATGSRRTPNQDLNFLIDELVEIALRALSPGINDPFTAVTALHWLGAAIAILGQRDLNILRARETDGEQPRVYPIDDNFAHFLARGFGAIRPHAASSPIASSAQLAAIADARFVISDPTRRTMLQEEGERLLARAKEVMPAEEYSSLQAGVGALSEVRSA